MIAEIEAGGPSDEYYDAKVKVLGEEIEHHVKEEEQRLEGIFAQARKAGIDMDALGVKLAERKAQLMSEIATAGLEKPELTTMETTQI
jgi:hypothetical protein